MPLDDSTELLTKPCYEGHGWSEFGSPLIRVEGPTTVETDERGRTIAIMHVKEVPTSSSIEDGFVRLSQDLFESMTEIGAPCTVHVQTPAGLFTADEMVCRQHEVSQTQVTMRFHCCRGQLVSAHHLPKYWRLPILNFHGSLGPALHLKELRHPLRLSSTAPISVFQIHGELGFLESVANYKHLTESQENGDQTPHITAALIASIRGSISNLNEIESWFPFELLSLLGLSSGSRVGAPWIEFFDECGRLVQRTHVQLGTDDYQRGDKFLDDRIHHGGIGRLITCALRSSEFGQQYMTVALNHLLLGNRDSQALEDKISHFSRALDALAKHFQFDVQNLLDGIAEEDQTAVKDTLRRAKNEIREIAVKRRAAPGSSNLERVAERTLSTPTCTDRNFGLSVLDLLSHFHLQDAAVADIYYASHPRTDGRTWSQVLSYYRGLSQHGGAFGFKNGEDSPVEVFRFANHLGDIVIRIILKLLGYDGKYQPKNAIWTQGKDLDWILPETPANELGFGRHD